MFFLKKKKKKCGKLYPSWMIIIPCVLIEICSGTTMSRLKSLHIGSEATPDRLYQFCYPCPHTADFINVKGVATAAESHSSTALTE